MVLRVINQRFMVSQVIHKIEMVLFVTLIKIYITKLCFLIRDMYILGGVYPQHSISYKQQMPNMGAFGQQSSLNQLGQLPTQMPVPNQIPVSQNQIIANPNSIGAIPANPLGLHIGQMNQLNGIPNAALTMPPQMVHNISCMILLNTLIIILAISFYILFFVRFHR